MKKLILLLCFGILTTGCSPTINMWEADKAYRFCSDKGGIYEYSLPVNLIVTCVNGDVLHISSLSRQELVE